MLADLLGLPLFVVLVGPAVGVAIMFGLAWLMAREVTRAQDGIVGVRAAAVWPWLWGILILIVVYGLAAAVAADEFESDRVEAVIMMTLGPATALVWAPMAAIFHRPFLHQQDPRWYGTLSVAAAGAAIMLVVVLAHAVVGVSLG